MNTTTTAAREEGRRAVSARLAGLHEDLLGLFAERKQAPRSRRRGALQRQLLLGLDLMAKIEEQVVLPALHEAVPQQAAAVRQAGGELELMRDLSLLATQTHTDNREMTLAVMEGLALLHFARLLELLAGAPEDGAEWAQIDEEIDGLLGRWRREVRAQGSVEDEDRDPVGLPPR